MNETARMMRVFHQTSGLPFDPYLAAISGGASMGGGSSDSFLFSQESVLSKFLSEQQNNHPKASYNTEDNVFGSNSKGPENSYPNNISINSRQYSTGMSNNSKSIRSTFNDYDNSSNLRQFASALSNNAMSMPDSSLKRSSSTYDGSSILKQFANSITNGNLPNNMSKQGADSSTNDIES